MRKSAWWSHPLTGSPQLSNVQMSPSSQPSGLRTQEGPEGPCCTHMLDRGQNGTGSSLFGQSSSVTHPISPRPTIWTVRQLQFPPVGGLVSNTSLQVVVPLLFQ